MTTGAVSRMSPEHHLCKPKWPVGDSMGAMTGSMWRNLLVHSLSDFDSQLPTSKCLGTAELGSKGRVFSRTPP
eukprot:15462367-Alexandrium_andersonii.AAC.1